MRRAVVSIPSNIAEGFSRVHNREYRQFLFVALGSCAKLETQMELSVELGYLDKTHYTGFLEKLDHEARMVRNLIKRLAGPAIRKGIREASFVKGEAFIVKRK